jgi:vitellogenic carboxypeptidase-like protein
MQGVVPKVEALLEKYNMLIYNGQLDVILGSPLCLEVLEKLSWSGETAWKQAQKAIWKIPSGEPGGYAISSGTLTHLAVRKAGHLVPAVS